MALIQPKKIFAQEKIQLKIDSAILKEVTEYCKWASINNIDDFFEQAAEFILKKDANWKKNKKS